MSHLDPDLLALLALNEPVASPEDDAHLRACPQCAAEVTEMRRTVRIAKATFGADTLEVPHERVWTGIAEQLQLSPGLETMSPSEPPAPAELPTRAGAAQPVRRRRLRALWVLAASLVLVAGAGLGGWLVMARMAPTPIAAATLDPLPAHVGAAGTAEVEEGRDGSRTLVVTLDAAANPDVYREVWLIRSDASALIGLGVLEGDSGSFVIPAGVDLAEYTLVDISDEPVDGDPTHSGDSIVRGELSFA